MNTHHTCTAAALLLLLAVLPARAGPAAASTPQQYPTAEACQQGTKPLRRDQPSCACIAQLTGGRTAYVLQCSKPAATAVLPPRAEVPPPQPSQEPAVASTPPDAMRAEQREPPGFGTGLYPQLRQQPPAPAQPPAPPQP